VTLAATELYHMASLQRQGDIYPGRSRRKCSIKPSNNRKLRKLLVVYVAQIM